jgi:RNA polymerase sigma-70 factor (ECF subfamily)
MLKHLPRLRRFAFALTGHRADADDLVQDTVERALRHLAQWEPGTRLDSWMYRIAQNLWIDRLRSRRTRGSSYSLDNAVQIVGADGVRIAESNLLFEKTMQAFQQLPEDQRSVAALILIEGVSYNDAASILGVPIGTVTSRLSRAREFLAERVLGARHGGSL